MKSSRHSKIAGDFGEMIVLYYLSRYGFECARIDLTGIDLLARSPKERRPRGIHANGAPQQRRVRNIDRDPRDAGIGTARDANREAAYSDRASGGSVDVVVAGLRYGHERRDRE